MDYLTQFRTEIETYSLKPRPKGAPRNEGTVWELTDIVNMNICDPIVVARWVKEGIHLTYLKQTTSKKILDGLLSNLK